MSKLMVDEEIKRAEMLDYKKMSELEIIMDAEGITDFNERVEYVKKNYSGQTFLMFMLKELQYKFLINYYDGPEEYTLSPAAIDGILKAFLFASRYVPDTLPKQAFNYLKNKSSMFISEIDKQLGD